MLTGWTLLSIGLNGSETGWAPAALWLAVVASGLERGLGREEIAGEPQPDVPVGRLGRVEEFADVVAFLCSERASYVCGINMLVDGGLTRGI